MFTATPAQGAVAASRQHAHHRFAHHHECWTKRCAANGTRLYNAHRRKERERREAREARERPPIGALEACIIREESGGDPNAVNGIYSGIGQWEESRWKSDGGLRYGETPTDATYAEQEKVLRGEGEAGMIDQQGQYDGCA